VAALHIVALFRLLHLKSRFPSRAWQRELPYPELPRLTRQTGGATKKTPSSPQLIRWRGDVQPTARYGPARRRRLAVAQSTPVGGFVRTVDEECRAGSDQNVGRQGQNAWPRLVKSAGPSYRSCRVTEGVAVPCHSMRQISPCRRFWTRSGRKVTRQVPSSCRTDGYTMPALPSSLRSRAARAWPAG
jgi:hypothetical protein